MAKRLSHIDVGGHPGMVDVGTKRISQRMATARSEVVFPPEAARQLHAAALRSKKGPVIDTAIVAGTLAVKRTHELIPFCHPLPIDGIRFECAFVAPTRLRIECTVSTEARTGVEMEALVGASVAALTVYDMCKSLTLGMKIVATSVISKQGGKRDFGLPPKAAGKLKSKREPVKTITVKSPK
jgi:cyclic pyranopterin monophosphate synthase